jgi:hypothetical protein
MNNLCFHSILASNQEVEFFTDILLDTDLAGEVMSNNPLVTELESIPQEELLAEEESAIEEQCEIEMAYDEENLKFEYCVVILDYTNDTAEEECGTWEECKSFVATYQRLMFGHSFTARFFQNGNDNEYACVQFIPTDTNPTGYITITHPRHN